MTKLRVGIIGVGGIAQQRHIPALLQFPELAELHAVSDTNVERAQEVAAKYKVPHVFQHYKGMFDEVDAVIICTPNKFHAEITVEALEAGVHVLCEKPMAMSAAECARMVEASRTSGKQLAIAYHYRHMPVSQAAKSVMDEVGTPLVVRVKALRRRKVPGWGVFTNKELQGGGSLIDYGCHLLDLALWLMGNPKHTAVMGSTYNALSRTPGQLNQWGSFNHETFGVDDHVTSYIKFENGASLLFETSWSANILDDEEHLSISGTKGGLSVFPFEMYTTKGQMLLNSQAAWIQGEEDPGLPQLQNFLEACVHGAELVVKPEEAMQVSQIIDEIYQSAGGTER
ncbi:Gfo/Idh/MocA family protein [Ectobacillus ponti]|uniref:Gfo/Idh/MocA family oxidoreductase n=1 Tax=Ectobacillus ponti TaxID=2961894 RepID=A0AA41XA64_9BACI|nr:Gfo/Idh/MocA family oxidoreductase [Ectobacillus ponti]MCP8969993.1 Gfo/Idh/MocA family oxidoreductase [Ectobacillus ponti]